MSSNSPKEYLLHIDIPRLHQDIQTILKMLR